jgi:hypothetical protein
MSSPQINDSGLDGVSPQLTVWIAQCEPKHLIQGSLADWLAGKMIDLLGKGDTRSVETRLRSVVLGAHFRHQCSVATQARASARRQKEQPAPIRLSPTRSNNRLM